MSSSLVGEPMKWNTSRKMYSPIRRTTGKTITYTQVLSTIRILRVKEDWQTTTTKTKTNLFPTILGKCNLNTNVFFKSVFFVLLLVSNFLRSVPFCQAHQQLLAHPSDTMEVFIVSLFCSGINSLFKPRVMNALPSN